MQGGGVSEEDVDARLVEVDFRPAPGEPPILVVNNGSRCKHAHLLGDEKTRAVTCRDCDAPVDAFDGLMSLIENEARWQQWLARAKAEKAAVERRIASLKIDERNARARVERARKRLTVTPGEHAELLLLRELAAAVRRRDWTTVRQLDEVLPKPEAPG